MIPLPLQVRGQAADVWASQMPLLLLLLVLGTFICRTIPASHYGSPIKGAQQLRLGVKGSPVPRDTLLAVCRDCRCSSVWVDRAFRAD